jgi:NAD(P)-dependent dehydrogenase (short-subunit alcohol dehydrogenase family)
VINIGSIHARRTKPEFVAYATSKGALETLTRALAVELGSRARVNAISPAAIDTPMLRAGFEGQTQNYEALAQCHPAGRIGTPVELAELALFLASDSALFQNGSIVDFSGGNSGRLHDPCSTQQENQ